MECIVKDIAIYYEDVGSGRSIFMVHGWPLDHRSLFHDLEPLFGGREGWRRIYPDLPGMGQTPGADWITTQDEMLDLLIEFIDNIALGEHFVVAGTSYGGFLIRGLVHHRGAQIDGVFMNVPVIHVGDRKTPPPKHRVRLEDDEFLAALTPPEQNIKEMVVTQSLTLLQDFREVIFPATAIADYEFLNRLDENTPFSFDLDSLAEPCQAPTLILTGRFDHWCGYQDAYQILEEYPNGTLAILDGTGHALSMEQKNLFRALVGEWLDRVETYTLNAGARLSHQELTRREKE